MARTILLVDDEPDVVLIIRGRLATWGYQVVTAANGQEALDTVNQHPLDLILLDLKMPLMDGPEVCRRLKADPRFSKIPIILITSSSQEAVTEELSSTQADDCVIKPFEPEELLAKIEKWIGKPTS